MDSLLTIISEREKISTYHWSPRKYLKKGLDTKNKKVVRPKLVVKRVSNTDTNYYKKLDTHSFYENEMKNLFIIEVGTFCYCYY